MVITMFFLYYFLNDFGFIINEGQASLSVPHFLSHFDIFYWLNEIIEAIASVAVILPVTTFLTFAKRSARASPVKRS